MTKMPEKDRNTFKLDCMAEVTENMRTSNQIEGKKVSNSKYQNANKIDNVNIMYQYSCINVMYYRVHTMWLASMMLL